MRVGFVLAEIFTGSSVALWPSVATMFPENGKDCLVVFPGGRLNSKQPLDKMKNSIYGLVNEHNVDGSIIWSSSLTGDANSEDVLNRFADMLSKPTVTMDGKTDKYPKIPDIRFNAYEGSSALVQHCIDVHNARRIVYLRGPLNHNSSRKRYQAYLDVLEKNNIDFDPKLVSKPSGWSKGGESLQEMIEGRNILPGKDFDMILCASDLMMYDAEQVLLSYGYVVGENVFICGFNDSIESRLINVPATTVRLPYSGMGKNAVLSLRALAEGRSCFDKELPTMPIIRRSCGCGNISHLSAVSTMSEFAMRISTDFMIGLDDARTIIERITNGPTESNLRILIDMIFSKGADNHELINVIRGFAKFVSEETMTQIAEIASSIIPSLLDRRMSKLSYNERQKRRVFNAFSNQLLETSNIQEIADVLSRNALSLGYAKLHLVFNDGSKSVLIGNEAIEFPEEMLVPPSESDLLDSGVWIAAPLCSETEYMGYLLMKTRNYDGSVCEEIRSVVSSAVKNARLFDTAKKAQQAAENAELARTNFFANVSENLRSPLTEISDMVLNSHLDEDARRIINERVIEVKRTIDLSLISTGELELERYSTSVSDVLGTFACYNDKGPLACVMLDEKRFRRIIEIVVSSIGETAQIDACMKRNGVQIRLYDHADTWDPSRNPSMDYVQQIVLLHNGTCQFEAHSLTMTIPYPTLAGSVSNAIEKGSVVACISAMADFEIDGVSQTLLEGDRFASKKRLPSQVGAIYWDSGFKGYNALTGLMGLISNDVYRNLPFICMECTRSRSFEDAIRSSVEAKGKVMLQIGPMAEDLHRWLQDPEIVTCEMSNVSTMMRRYTPRLVMITLEHYEGMEQAEENLRVCLKNIRHKYQTPVVVCTDYIDAKLVEDLSLMPNIMVVNACIVESDEFAMRVRAILGGAELLAPQTGSIVKKAQLYLCEHATLPISRWQVAEEVHTSEDYLTRVFKKELGLSPWDYLNRYRVWLAGSLLRNTGMTVNEVSIATGFQDQAYFCRVFKKVKGYSPIHLRSGKKGSK
ncbi:MAG: helix-turn-helix domain-containing protein [Sphaerochaetaceae bacterium]|nr:helix-turn-helix domain-containing protein [Sphaerochaetaceae bacterium]